jgi:hypothetical protein
MSNIKALYEIAPSVRYAVGSMLPVAPGVQNVEVDMPLLFERSIRDGQTPDQIARALAKRAMKDPNNSGFRAIAAMNLAKLAPLVAQFAKLTKALLANLRANRAAILDSMNDARHLGYKTVGHLWEFARTLMNRISDPAIKAQARALFRLQAAATLFEKSGDYDDAAKKWTTDNSGGLWIYLPGKKDAFLKRGYAQTRFARETGWNKLLEALYP